MKPLQTMLFFAFFLCVNMTITAQKLLEYISKDAAIVAGINPSALKEKANFEAIRKMEFYQAILDQIPKGKDSETGKIFSDIFKTPEKYGMDFYSPSYFFVEKGKDGFFINYIFKLSDANTFNAFFQEQIAKDGKSEIQNLAHYQLINNNGVAFAWNEKIVLISAGENKSKFQGADISTFKSDVNEVLKSLVERAMKLDKQHSILQNPQFLKAQAMPNDAFIWMDYGYMIEIGKMSKGRLNKSPMPVPEIEQMYELVNGTFLMMGLHFEQGKMQWNSKYFFNQKLYNIVEELLDVNINPRFTRYIAQKDLLGYYTLAFNIEKTIKGLFELYSPVLGKKKTSVDELLTQGLDSLGLAMRPSQIYNMFKGDILFAITGTKEFTREVITYDYDEDFNRTEVKKQKRETLPLFRMMMSYNNKKDLMTFIQMGEEATMLENRGKYYKMNIPKMPEMYLALQKGILFLTNDKAFVSSNLKRGLKRKYRINKKHRLNLKNNVQVFHMDINNVLAEVANMSRSMNKYDNQLLNISKQNMDSFWMTAQKPKAGVMNAGVDLIFSNQQVNSLEQLVRIFNDIYLTFSKTKRG